MNTMKLMKIYFIAALIAVLMSCGSGYEFWDISKFNMDNNALEDKEEIKLIYTSQGPDYNQDLEYYIHYIVVSQKTGDTVNVLTTGIHGITKNDGDKIFIFFNKDNLMTKLAHMDTDHLTEPRELKELEKTEMKKITKVARDPEFDYVADNNYPTIIGTIGTTVINFDLP